MSLHERLGGRNEVEYDDEHGRARKIGLNAVPDDGDDASDERWNIRAEHAKGHPAHDRERDCALLTRHTDQIRQHLYDENAENQAYEHLPARQAE